MARRATTQSHGATAAVAAFSTWCSPASGQSIRSEARLAGRPSQQKPAAARIQLQMVESRQSPARATGAPTSRARAFQHGRHLRPLPREYRRHARLQDARLLAGDGFQAPAQEAS